MVTREALKQAIADLEKLAMSDTTRADPTVPILARLYTTYAQVTLEYHGIRIDLPAVCGDHMALEPVRPAAPPGP